MSRIAFGEVLDASNPVLDVEITDAGVLSDPATLEFTISSMVSGSPVQVYPVAGRQPIVIADPPTGSRIATGHFFAPWTVPATGLAAGTYRIDWYFAETVGGTEFTASEEFEIYNPAAVGPSFYTTIARFRTFYGISASVVSDADLTGHMILAHQLLERFTRQFFSPRTVEFELDGNNSQTLFLPVPVISVEWVRLNGSAANLDASYFVVYNGREPPNDDRHNPRISLDRDAADSIFRTPFAGPHTRFLKGRRNQRVRGVFGYTEADGSTPAPIIEAVERMIIERIANPALGSPPITIPTPGSGPLVMEKVDGHEYRLSDMSSTSPRPAGLDGITSDSFVRDVLRMYRAPKGIGATSSWLV